MGSNENAEDKGAGAAFDATANPPSDYDFATQFVDITIPIETLREEYPDSDDMTLGALQRTIRPYTKNQPIFVQGKTLGNTRLFKVSAGTVGIVHYKGNPNDTTYKPKDMTIFHKVVKSDNTYIPISLKATVAPFSIVSLDRVSAIMKVDFENAKQLLANEKALKVMTRFQGDLILEICKKISLSKSGPSNEIVPLLAINIYMARRSSEVEKYVLSELNKLYRSLIQFDLKDTKPIGVQTTLSGIGNAIRQVTDDQPKLLSTALLGLRSLIVRQNGYSILQKKVISQNSVEVVHSLQQAIEIGLKIFCKREQ